MSRHARLVLALLCCAGAASPSFAQNTISFQGLLADDTGVPVADDTYSTTFRIYAMESGGTELWTEVQPVATVDGLYHVQLGSVTPFAGIDFGQPLWLGITVDPDTDELTPRTKLESAPSAFSLVLPYQGSADTTASSVHVINEGDGNAIFGVNTGGGTAGAFIVDNESNDYTGVYGQSNGTGAAIYGRHVGAGSAGRFHIDNVANSAPALLVETSGTGMGIFTTDTLYVQNSDLGMNPAARRSEDIVVEAFDAFVGLYSDGGGGYGSGIQLGQIDPLGELVDKWSLVRRTSGSAGENMSALLFTYGTDPAYSINPVQVQFTTSGDILAPSGFVRADSVVYNNPKTGYASVHGSVFVPTAVESTTLWDAFNSGFYFTAGSVDGARASIQLPHGATIESLTCTIKDNSGSRDLECKLCEGIGNSCGVLASVTSSGSASTYKTYPTAVAGDPVVDNATHAYYLLASPTVAGWSADSSNLIINSVTVEYTLPGAP